MLCTYMLYCTYAYKSTQASIETCASQEKVSNTQHYRCLKFYLVQEVNPSEKPGWLCYFSGTNSSLNSSFLSEVHSHHWFVFSKCFSTIKSLKKHIIPRLTFIFCIFALHIEVSQQPMKVSVSSCCNSLVLKKCFCSLSSASWSWPCHSPLNQRQERRRSLPTLSSPFGMSFPLISKTSGKSRISWCCRSGKRNMVRQVLTEKLEPIDLKVKSYCESRTSCLFFVFGNEKPLSGLLTTMPEFLYFELCLITGPQTINKSQSISCSLKILSHSFKFMKEKEVKWPKSVSSPQ